MKKMQKVLSLVLTVLMLFSSVESVSAAVIPTDTVTATETADGNWLDNSIERVNSAFNDLSFESVSSSIGALGDAISEVSFDFDSLDFSGWFNNLKTSYLRNRNLRQLVNLSDTVTTITENDESAESIVQYGVSSTYEVLVPCHILATKPGADVNKYTVTASEVVIPVHTELACTVDKEGTMLHNDDNSIELDYQMYREDTEKDTDTVIQNNRQRLFKVPAGFKEGTSATIYAVLADDVKYAGVYEENNVTFNLKVTDHTYTDEEIEASSYLFKIGATEPQYVLAQFNEDYTSATIFANGESDGLMMDWDGESYTTNPFYQHKDTLTSIEIVSNLSIVNNIGDYAFAGCEGLTGDIILPNTITSVGANAFNGCTGITGVRFADGSYVPVSGGGGALALQPINLADTPETEDDDNLTSEVFENPGCEIENNAFEGCSALEAVYFGNTVTKIGYSSFKDCTSLTAVETGDNLTEIGRLAFEGCTALETANLTNVTKISTEAFKDCTSLQNVSMPKVKTIGNNAFENCSSLSAVLDMPSVETIGTDVFLGCSDAGKVVKLGAKNIKKINSLPANTTLSFYDTVESVNDNCFEGRTEIIDVISFPAAVVGTGAYAFKDCVNLSRVVLGDDVTAISYGTFLGCTGISGTLEFPDGVLSIGSSAFADCSNIEEIKLNKVSLIEQGAFKNCTNITSIDSKASSINVHEKTFENVVNVTSLAIGIKNVTKNATKGFNTGNYVNNWSVSFYETCSKVDINSFLENNSLDSVEFIGGTNTTIESGAFKDCTSIRRVVFSGSISAIGDNAFSGCTSIEELVINDGLVNIGDFAFKGCSAIANDLVIPDSVLSIGNSAFYGCDLIPSIDLGEGVEVIGDSAFSGLKNVSGTLVLPDSLLSIGTHCFSYTTFSDISFGTGIKTIASYAFYGCKTLCGELVIPNTVTTLGSYAFAGVRNFVSEAVGPAQYTSVVIGSGVTEIGEGCFKGSAIDDDDLEDANFDAENRGAEKWNHLSDSFSKLQSVTFLGDVTVIGNNAFENCYLLEEVEIPDACITIGEKAFKGDFNMQVTSWGRDLKVIDDYAFQGCHSIAGDLVLPDKLETIGFGAFSTSGEGFASRLTDGTVSDDDRSASITSLTIPDSCKTIKPFAFRECDLLTTLDLGEGVEIIGLAAFERCTSLTGTLVIPDSCRKIEGAAFSSYSVGSWTSSDEQENDTYIESEFGTTIRYTNGNVVKNSKYRYYSHVQHFQPIGAYYYCRDTSKPTQITGVQFGSGLKEIGDYAFYNCGTIRSNIVLGENVETVGRYAFGNVAVPETLTLNDGLITIGNGAFSGCSGFEGTLTIPETVKTIGGSAFAGCSGYKSISFGTAVQTIGGSAFANCSGLNTEVNIPSLVTRIEGSTFENCTRLPSVNLTNAVTYIGSSAFKNCTKLADIDLCDSIVTIDGYAFQGDVLLTTIDFPETLNSIGYNAFDTTGLTGLLTIPQAVTNVGGSAFANSTHITQVSAPASAYQTGEAVFQNCTGLTRIDIPEGTTSVSNYVFNGCSGVTDAPVLPSTLTAIGAYAFQNCSRMTGELVIPDACETISAYAFNGCLALTGLDLGDGIVTVGDYAFFNTYNVTSVLTFPSTCKTIGSYAFSATEFKDDGEIVHNRTKTTKYSGLVFNDGLTNIGYKAFYGSTGLTGELRIPGTVENIAEYAFSLHCRAHSYRDTICNVESGPDLLDSIVIENGVKTIGQYAFAMRKNVSSITLSNTLTTIGNNAFEYCINLDGELVIPDSVVTIDTRAFYRCDNLDELWLGNGLVTLNDEAFNRLYGEITNYPSSLITIGNNVFGTDNMDEYGAVYSEDFEYLIDFDNIQNISSYTVNPATKVICSNAFKSVSGLDEVILPEGLLTIGNEAFYNCRISKCELPSTLEYVGDNAFGGVIDYYYEYETYNASTDDIWSDKDVVFDFNLNEGTSPDTAIVTGHCPNCNAECKFTYDDLDFATSTYSVMGFYDWYLESDSEVWCYCYNCEGFRVPNDEDEYEDYESLSYGEYGCIFSMSDILAAADYQEPESYGTAIHTGHCANCGADCNLTYYELEEAFITYSYNGYYDYNAQSDSDYWCYCYNCDGYSTSTGEQLSYEDYGCMYSMSDVLESLDGKLRLGHRVFRTTGPSVEEFEFGANFKHSGTNAFPFANKVTFNTTNITSEVTTGIGCGDVCCEVILNNGVEIIGTNAFRGKNTKGVLEIPSSVEHIYGRAFWGTRWDNIILNEGLVSIGDAAFNNVSVKGVDLVIPNTCVAIGDYAFASCNYANYYTVGWVKNGDYYENSSCYDVIRVRNVSLNNGMFNSISIGSSLKTIGDYAFSATLKNPEADIVIGESVKTIGTCAFASCVFNDITFNNGAMNVGSDAFYKSEYNKVTTNSLTNWCEKSFDSLEANPTYYTKKLYVGDNELTSFTLPADATKIGSYCFAGLENITSVTVDRTVPVGVGAFEGCVNITSLAFAKENVSNEDVFDVYDCEHYANDFTLTLLPGTDALGENLATDGQYEKYGYTERYSSRSYERVKERVVNYTLTKLVSLVISEGVTSIGDYAFVSASNLRTVSFPTTLTTIGEYAFARTGLTNLELNSGLKTIGSNAFLDCTEIESVSIPETVEVIGDDVFKGCSSITNFELHMDKQTSIGDNLTDSANISNIIYDTPVVCKWFSRLYSDYSITLTNKVKKIVSNCFNSDEYLSEVIWECTDIKTIGSYAFCEIDCLPEEIVIGNNCTFIGCRAFCDTNIESFECGSVSRGYIDDDVFYNCHSLKRLSIGSGYETYNNNYNTFHLFYNSPIEYLSIDFQLDLQKQYGSDGGYYDYDANDYFPYTIKEMVFGSKFKWLSADFESLASLLDDDDETRYWENPITYRTLMPNLEKITVSENNPLYTTVTGVLYNKNTTKTLLVPNKVAGDIIIPDGITHIGYNDESRQDSDYGWFAEKEGITSVTISDTVINVDAYSFYNLENMTLLHIGDGVSNIGEYAFSRCPALEVLYVGNSVPEIGDSMFFNCVALRDLTLGNSITRIGDSAFYNCNQLQELEIKDECTYVGATAFYGCNSLETLSLGNGLNEILGGAFYGCYVLGGIEIPNTVTKIGEKAFCGCNSASVITLSDNITEIGNEAFCGCNSVQVINVPANIVSIGDSAFEGCHSLTGSIVIPDSCTYLGSRAFMDSEFTSQVSSLSIGSGLDTIGNMAFVGNAMFETITCAENNPSYVAVDNILYSKDMKILVLGSRVASQNFEIPASVTSIGPWAFAGNGTIKNLVLPQTLTYINEGAFFNSSIETLNVGNTIAMIYGYAFANCTSLTGNIQLPNSLIYIGEHAFENCPSIGWIGVNAGTQWVGEDAFTNTNFTLDTDNIYLQLIDETLVPINDDFELPFIGKRNDSDVTYSYDFDTNTLTISGNGDMKDWDKCSDYECPNCGYTFNPEEEGRSYCPNCWNYISDYEPIPSSALYPYMDRVETIVIEDGVTNIGNYAFYTTGESHLTRLVLGKGLKTIGEGALSGHNGITTIEVDEDNTSFSMIDGIFYGNNNTEILWVASGISGTVTIPEGITSIGDNVFAECEELTEVVLPESCKSLGNATFAASGLTTINLENVETIGDECFCECVNLDNVDLSSAKEIGAAAFAMCPRMTEVMLDSVLTLGESAFYGLPYLTKIGINIGIKSYEDAFGYDEEQVGEDFEPSTVVFNVIGEGERIDMDYFDLMMSMNDREEEPTEEEYEEFERLESEIMALPMCYMGLGEYYDAHEVVIGDGVINLGSIAIVDEGGILTKVTLGKNVETMHSDTFAMCMCIEEFVIPEENTNFINEDGVIYSSDYSDIVLVLPTYESDTLVVHEGVTKIGMYGLCALQVNKVVLPQSMESISGYGLAMGAFTELDLGGVTYLKQYACCENSSLNYIVFSDNITEDTFGEGAFEGCGESGTVAGNSELAEMFAEYLGWEYASKCDHDNIEFVAGTEGTCSTPGYTDGYRCTDCGRFVSGHQKVTVDHIDENGDTYCDVCEKHLVDIDLDTATSVTIKSYDVTKLAFIPQVNGIYSFYSEGSDDTYGYIYDADMNEVAHNDDGDNGSNFKVTCELEAGKTYYLGSRFYNEERSGSFNVFITLDEETCAHANKVFYEGTPYTCTTNGLSDGYYCTDCESWCPAQTVIVAHHTDENNNNICDVCGKYANGIDLNVQKSYTVVTSGEQRFKFTPMKSGTYLFTSNYYNQINLYDSYACCVNSGYGTSLSAELTGGQTYYFSQYVWSGNTAVTYKLEATYIYCDHDNTTSVPGVASTCTTDGYTDGVYCEDCGMWIEGHAVISSCHTDNNNDGICDLCSTVFSDILIGKAKEISVPNSNYSSNYTTQYYMFTPKKSGTYEFSVTHNETSDTGSWWANVNVTVYDSNKNYINQGSGQKEANMSNYLEGGKTYYVSVYNGYTTYDLPATLLVSAIELECDHTSTTEVGEVAASCDSDGHTAGVICNECGSVISGYETIKSYHTDENADGICDLCSTVMSDILIGQTKEVKIPYYYNSNQSTYFIFTPKKSGTYTFTVCNESTTNVYVAVCDSHKGEMSSSSDSYECVVSDYLTGGEVYYLCVNEYNVSPELSAKISLSASGVDCEHETTKNIEAVAETCTKDGSTAGVVCIDCGCVISGCESVKAHHTDNDFDNSCDVCKELLSDIYLGRSVFSTFYTDYQFQWFKFTPKITGAYSFTSLSDVRTYGVICNSKSSYDSIYSGYGSGAKGQFYLSGTLEAGKTYYLGLYVCSCDEENGTPVEVRFNISNASCNHNNTRYFGEKLATCSSVGHAEGEICLNCGSVVSGFEKYDVSTEHKNVVHYEAENISCYNDGYSAGDKCEDCGNWISGHEKTMGVHIDENNDKLCDICGEVSSSPTGYLGVSVGESVTYGGIQLGVPRCVLNFSDIGQGQLLSFTAEHSATYRITSSNTTFPMYVMSELIEDETFKGTFAQAIIAVADYGSDVVFTLEKGERCLIYGLSRNGEATNLTLSVDEYLCDHDNVTNVSAVAGTCEDFGYTAGTKCEDCGIWLSGHELTEKGHIDTNRDLKCDLCDESLSDIQVGILETSKEGFERYPQYSEENNNYCARYGGYYKTFKFVPEYSGRYKFTIDNTASHRAVLVSNGKMDSIGDSNDTKFLTVELEAYTQYYITVYTSGSADSFKSFKVEFLDCAHQVVTVTEGVEPTCQSDGVETTTTCCYCHQAIRGGNTLVKTMHTDYDADGTCDSCFTELNSMILGKEMIASARNEFYVPYTGEYKFTIKSDSGYSWLRYVYVYSSDNAYEYDSCDTWYDRDGTKETNDETSYTFSFEKGKKVVFVLEDDYYAAISPRIIVEAVCEHTNTTNVAAVVPTCVCEGYTAGVKCDDCLTVVSGCETIPALGHTDANNDGVCDTCGTYQSVCYSYSHTTTSDNIIGIEDFDSEYSGLARYYVADYNSDEEGDFEYFTPTATQKYKIVLDGVYGDEIPEGERSNSESRYNYSSGYKSFEVGIGTYNETYNEWHYLWRDNGETITLEKGVKYRIAACFAEVSNSENIITTCQFHIEFAKGVLEADYCSHIHTTVISSVASTCTSAGHTSGVWCEDCRDWVEKPQSVGSGSHVDVDGNLVCDTCHEKLNVATESYSDTVDVQTVIANGECQKDEIDGSYIYTYTHGVAKFQLTPQYTSKYCIKVLSIHQYRGDISFTVEKVGDESFGIKNSYAYTASGEGQHSYAYNYLDLEAGETYIVTITGESYTYAGNVFSFYVTNGLNNPNGKRPTDAHSCEYDTVVPAVIPGTCLEIGHEAYKVCSVCGKHINENTRLIRGACVDDNNDGVCDVCGKVLNTIQLNEFTIVDGVAYFTPSETGVYVISNTGDFAGYGLNSGYYYDTLYEYSTNVSISREDEYECYNYSYYSSSNYNYMYYNLDSGFYTSQYSHSGTIWVPDGEVQKISTSVYASSELGGYQLEAGVTYKIEISGEVSMIKIQKLV